MLKEEDSSPESVIRTLVHHERALYSLSFL